MIEDPAILKRVVLLTLREKHGAKVKELAVLIGDPKIKTYLELKAGVGLLERAIAETETAVAHAAVGFKPQPQPKPHPKPKGRAAAWALHSTGGEVLAQVHQHHVYQKPYAVMLREFRGQAQVPRKRVVRWFKKEYGVSDPVAAAYLVYAIQQRTAVRYGTKGTSAHYDFPSQYDARVVLDEQLLPKSDPEEIRRADPAR